MSNPSCDLLQLIGLDMQYVRWKPSNNNHNSRQNNSNNNTQNQQKCQQQSNNYNSRRNSYSRNASQHQHQTNLANSSSKLSQSNPNLKWTNNCPQTAPTRNQQTHNRRRESSPWPLMGDDSAERSVSSTSSLSSGPGGVFICHQVGAGDHHQRSQSASADVTQHGGHAGMPPQTPQPNEKRESKSASSSNSSINSQQPKQGFQKQHQQNQYNNHHTYRRNGYNTSNNYQNGHYQQNYQSFHHHQQQQNQNHYHHNHPGNMGNRRNHQNRYYNTFMPNNYSNNFNNGGNVPNNSINGAQKRFQNGRHAQQMPVAMRCRRASNSHFVQEPSSMFPLTNDPRFIELLNAGTPPDQFLTKANLVQITKPPEQLTNGSIWDELSKAVWNKFLTNQQTKETYEKKLSLWKCLYVYLKIVYPRYSLFMVGSTMSGFGSNTSDVDMCLMVRQTELDQRSEALYHLTHIMEHFISYVSKYFVNIELIHAKVPILKFKYINDGLDIDLSCNNTVGIRNTHLLFCYAKYDWRVRPLVLVVKLWAQWHDINSAKDTTVSSYSLALMVIHFLQCGVRPAVLPCLQQSHAARFSPHTDVANIDFHQELTPLPPDQQNNSQPIGQLLVEFFNYYDQFDYRQYAISVRQGCCLLIDECRKVRTSKNEPHQWKYLCIEEPFDLTNTARSVNNMESFEKIRNVIHQTAAILNATGSLDAIFRLDLVNGWAHHL